VPDSLGFALSELAVTIYFVDTGDLDFGAAFRV
jgi:hypothetical protein